MKITPLVIPRVLLITPLRRTVAVLASERLPARDARQAPQFRPMGRCRALRRKRLQVRERSICAIDWTIRPKRSPKCPRRRALLLADRDLASAPLSRTHRPAAGEPRKNPSKASVPGPTDQRRSKPGRIRGPDRIPPRAWSPSGRFRISPHADPVRQIGAASRPKASPRRPFNGKTRLVASRILWAFEGAAP